jgi:hypothetical protein
MRISEQVARYLCTITVVDTVFAKLLPLFGPPLKFPGLEEGSTYG